MSIISIFTTPVSIATTASLNYFSLLSLQGVHSCSELQLTVEPLDDSIRNWVIETCSQMLATQELHQRRPRSLEMVDGTPNRAIQPVAKVRATVSAVMSFMGKSEAIDAREQVSVSMRWGEGADNVNVDLIKASIWRCKS